MSDSQPTPVPERDKSTPELLRDLSDQMTTLVRQELQLAKAEMTSKGKQAGLGIGMFGAAGVFAVWMLGALTAAAILALSLAWAILGRSARRDRGTRDHRRDPRPRRAHPPLAGSSADAGADDRDNQGGHSDDQRTREGGAVMSEEDHSAR